MSQCHDIYEAVDDRHTEVKEEVVIQCHDLYVAPTFAPFDTTAQPATPAKKLEVPLTDKPAPDKLSVTTPEVGHDTPPRRHRGHRRMRLSPDVSIAAPAQGSEPALRRPQFPINQHLGSINPEPHPGHDGSSHDK